MPEPDLERCQICGEDWPPEFIDEWQVSDTGAYVLDACETCRIVHDDEFPDGHCYQCGNVLEGAGWMAFDIVGQSLTEEGREAMLEAQSRQTTRRTELREEAAEGAAWGAQQ